MNKVLVFDIETAGDLEADAAVPEPKAPGNLKDPAKIAAAIEEKKAEQAAMAALDPDTATITAIGMAIVSITPQTPYETEIVKIDAHLVGDEDVPAEVALLAKFWAAFEAAGGRACGYNIIGFDIPMIQRRSFA